MEALGAKLIALSKCHLLPHGGYRKTASFVTFCPILSSQLIVTSFLSSALPRTR